MAEIIGVSTWMIAAFRWGDWRNFNKYQSTILYFIFFDLLYYYITYDHRLWSLSPTPPLKYEIVCLAGEFIVFACTILIFIGRYPVDSFISVRWTALWVFIYTLNEWILLKTGTMVYTNGWTLFHSFLFSIMMFIFLRLYFKKPLLTLLISIPIPGLLIIIFSIPLK